MSYQSFRRVKKIIADEEDVLARIGELLSKYMKGHERDLRNVVNDKYLAFPDKGWGYAFRLFGEKRYLMGYVQAMLECGKISKLEATRLFTNIFEKYID